MSLQKMRQELISYKTGSFLKAEFGENAFDAAEQGEMEKMKIRIGLFGFTGSGKSSFVNSVSKSLLDDNHGRAVVQSTGAEGTIILEEFFYEYKFRMIDTRGFMDLERCEESELFRILYGQLEDGENIVREGEVISTNKMKKTPLCSQLHVVMWFVKSTDPRLTQQIYNAKNAFVRSHLFDLGVTIIPVVTFADCITKSRDLVKTHAMNTGDGRQQPHFITNFLPELSTDYDESNQRAVLQLVKKAIQLGEESLRARQMKRFVF
ncbi:uncharacterized protein LOC102804573 isoform X1 [Saccoglossus kowalevskii]|uniref:Uncharacterized protein LOC102804573 n=1 Tax=Saccoglossus kowalevskii TaxID=10224 RepID=A0ABM0MVJ5_SACKO|nr:PREDICTED: uncharacterized protein LOC102804573 [Saccoglossus kowalevskii]